MKARTLDLVPAWVASGLVAGWLAGCGGAIGSDEPDQPGTGTGNAGAPSSPKSPTGNPPAPGAPVGNLADLARLDALGAPPVRRLTQIELRNSLVEVFGVDPGAALMNMAPEDIAGGAHYPFSSDPSRQAVDNVVIGKYDGFATEYARAVARPGPVAALGGCTPSGAGDSACFQKLIARVARKALRRPIAAAEIQSYGGFLTFAMQDNDFYVAVDLLVKALVQSPEFLYRLEGTSAPAGPAGVYKLNDFEIATRMSYLLWGSGPDDALLAAAESGLLRNAADRAKQLDRLFRDRRAISWWQQFHSEWLGYEGGRLLPAALGGDMVAETNALVAQVLQSGKPWKGLLTADETFVSPTLAKHYGLAAPAPGAPVKYPAGRGGGILAHATFLIHGSKFGDTSPTLRGAEILTRLMCYRMPPLPVDVDADAPPKGPSPTSCKRERYDMGRRAGCASCHALTDELGFGLENHSPTGQWRTSEPMQPSCSIAGTGQFSGMTYSGPRELGQLLASRPEVEACSALQVFRFLTGRQEADIDQPTVRALHEQIRTSGTLAALLTSVVTSPAFAHKVIR